MKSSNCRPGDWRLVLAIVIAIAQESAAQGTSDVPASAPELPIIKKNDYSNLPGKEMLLEPGKNALFLTPEDATVGSLLLGWSIKPWVPPAAPEGKAPPAAYDPGARLTISLSGPREGSQPINMEVYVPSSSNSNATVRIDLNDTKHNIYRPHYEGKLAAAKVGGLWRFRWNHGLVTIDASGETIAEVYLPREMSASGISTVLVESAGHTIGISGMELQGVRPPRWSPAMETAHDATKALAAGSRDLAQSGHITEALDRALDRARLMQTANLGPRAPLEAASALMDAADLAILAGRYEEVGPQDEQALELLRSICGKDHPASLETHLAIARQIGEIAKRSTPADPAARAALDNLATRLTGLLGPKSWLLHEARLAIYRLDRASWLGPEKAARLAGYRAEIAAASSSYRVGRLREVEAAAAKAVASARFVGPGAEAELADALTLLGLGIAGNGDAERSVTPFREALAIRERHLGAAHPSTFTARNNLGYALFGAGRYRDAASEARTVYLGRSQALGRHAPGTWQALRNVIAAESEAFSRTNFADEFRRTPAELGGLIERGASQSEPWSSEFLWASQDRSPLPILKMYFQPFAPAPSTWRWPERPPVSLLEDASAYELGRARLLQAGFGSIAMIQVAGAQPVPPARQGNRIFASLLGVENAWTTLAWWGDMQFSMANPQRAIDRFKRDFGVDHPLTATVANNFAVSILTPAVVPRDAAFPPTKPEAIAALGSAETLARAALEIMDRRLGEGHPLDASVRELLGVILYHRGQTEEARGQIERCLAARRQAFGDTHPAAADADNTLGITWYRAGRYPEARVHLSKALRVRQEFHGGLLGDALESLNDLGVVLRAQGDLMAARRCFERILRDSHPLSGVHKTAEANLAVILIELGDYDEAKRLLAGSTGGPTRRPDNTTLLNLGAIALAQGDDPEAEQLFRKVLESSPGNPVALNNLGVIARKRGQFDEATRLFETVLEPAKPGGGGGSGMIPGAAAALERSVTRVSLGLLQARRGDFGSALGHLDLALNTFREIYPAGHPRVADTLRRRGIVQLLAGRPEEARASLAEALRLKIAMVNDIVPALSESESLAFLAGLTDRDPLLATFRDKAGGEAEAYDAVWSTRAIVSATLAERRGLELEDPKAGPLLDRLRSVRSQISAMTLHPESVQLPPQQIPQVLLALNGEKQRIERELAGIYEPFRAAQARARARFSDLAARLPVEVTVVDFVRYADWSDRDAVLKTGRPPFRYAAFVLRRGDAPAGFVLARIELGPAEPIDRDVEAWRGRIRARSGGLARGASRAEFEEKPDPGTDAEFASTRLRERLWAPLEAHLGPASTVVIVPEGALTRLPWAALPGKDPSRYLIEDYALATASSGQQVLVRLGQKLEPRARDLVVGGLSYDDPPTAEETSPIGAQARPAVESQNKWDFLDGTRVEVEKIARLAGPDVEVASLGRSEAGESSLRRLLPKAAAVHLATHGFFADDKIYASVLDQPPALDPIEVSWQFRDGAGKHIEPTALLTVTGRNPLVLSGIVLSGANRPPQIGASGLPDGADGILTGEEVASLDLRATRLVVLSACETGLGKSGGGEGVFGLQRAFQLAGVRTTVASLWKVDDDATQALMVEFYGNLWQKHLGTLEALRQAQIAMIHRYDVSSRTLSPTAAQRPADAGPIGLSNAPSPFFWAAFVLGGDWR